jgi:hypothetical protein
MGGDRAAVLSSETVFVSARVLDLEGGYRASHGSFYDHSRRAEPRLLGWLRLRRHLRGERGREIAMTVSTVIDMIIGLSFTFFLLALASSAIGE